MLQKMSDPFCEKRSSQFFIRAAVIRTFFTVKHRKTTALTPSRAENAAVTSFPGDGINFPDRAI
ncbi:hypothetical protein SB48_HM08orf05870 [Heyndrickxia coagulans]|uniref:Uncharacterized protein n=1 Tax=Heyndrickxia coagulans TaxID=1398 RepID=A0AAN0T9L7_HEYCO|nr:hypothetical protein SB48_HM08orf05870 [Heyndrickxia coagulans]